MTGITTSSVPCDIPPTSLGFPLNPKNLATADVTDSQHPAGRPGRRLHGPTHQSGSRNPKPLTISASAEMTLPSVVKDLLMLAPSCTGRRENVREPWAPPAQRHPPGLAALGPGGTGSHGDSGPRPPVRVCGSPPSRTGHPGASRAPSHPPGWRDHRALKEANTFLTPKTAGRRQCPLRTLASRPHRHLAAVSSVGKAAEGLAFAPGRPLAAGRSVPPQGPLERAERGDRTWRGQRSALP